MMHALCGFFGSSAGRSEYAWPLWVGDHVGRGLQFISRGLKDLQVGCMPHTNNHPSVAWQASLADNCLDYHMYAILLWVLGNMGFLQCLFIAWSLQMTYG